MSLWRKNSVVLMANDLIKIVRRLFHTAVLKKILHLYRQLSQSYKTKCFYVG